MASFLQDQLTKRNINSPTVTCRAQRGIIQVSVQGGRAPIPPPPAQTRPIEGVTATAAGPDNPAAQDTKNDGRRGFGPLHLGNYTVTLTFPPGIASKYDTANVQPGISQNKVLNAGVVTQYDFIVPWHWIEFDVSDSANQPDQNVPYKLKYQPPIGGAWTLLESGYTPANGKVEKDEVPTGRYKLSIPILSNPQWSAPAFVDIGANQTLTVSASGFDAGETGEFQIIDAFDDGKVIHTIPATITAAGPNFQMQVTWMPSEGNFSALTQSRIRFKAKCDRSVCLSDIRTVRKTQILNVERPGSVLFDTQITAYFSGGGTWNGNSPVGQAMIPTPWKEQIVRIDLPAITRCRIKVQGSDQADSTITKP